MDAPAALSGAILMLLLLGGWAGAEEEVTIQVIWADPAKLLKDPTRVAEEIERQFAALGVGVCWEVVGKEPFVRSRLGVTVMLRGGEPGFMGFEDNVMGAAYPAARDRTVYVFFAAVARSVGWRRTTRGVVAPYVARALGRVAVHEIVHALAPELGHDESGLMHEHLTGFDLRKEQTMLEPEFAAELRKRLVALRRGEGEPPSARSVCDQQRSS